MYHPQLFTLETFRKRYFKRIKKVTKERFEESLKESIDDKDVAILSFYNAIASASKNVPMSNAFTIRELDNLGFEWSRIGTKYLSYMKKIR